MFEADDVVSGRGDDWLSVTGAGSHEVNGKYVRDGKHAGQPRWRKVGYVIPSRGQKGVWLRAGSDGNWCIVNNSDGQLPLDEKQFFYNAADFEGWRTDTHGVDSPPTVAPAPAGADSRRRFQRPRDAEKLRSNERLYQYIQDHGRALIVVPRLEDERRVIVMHMRHFSDATLVYAMKGRVSDDSFPGMDDECVSINDGNNEFGPSVWSYLGK